MDRGTVTGRAAPLRSAEYNTAMIQRMRRFYAVLQLVPSIAARHAFRSFIRPDPMPKLKLPNHGEGGYELIKGHRIYIHVGGHGPTIVLVHGWEASVGTMRILFDALASRGFRVVAFDLPGHGMSSGGDTIIATVSEIIQEMGIRHGPVAGAIGHSFGALALAHAIGNGLPIDALVLLSSPSSFTAMMDRFTASLNLGGPVCRRFYHLVARRLAPFDISRDFEMPVLLAQSRIPVFFVHDKLDPIIPIDEAQRLAATVPLAQFLMTEGYGHSGIVFQRDIVRQSVNFLKNHLGVPQGEPRRQASLNAYIGSVG